MGKIISSDIFAGKAEQAAKELLGTFLVREIEGRQARYMITETEAYVGPHDLASHSSKGRTPRTEVMFGKPGTVYVYFIYGMYFMLNIVTGKEGYPAAVLIRGVEGIKGPGRVARALSVTKDLNGLPLSKETGLWIEEGVTIESKDIIRTPRIGIEYAGDVWKNKKLRFVLRK